MERNAEPLTTEPDSEAFYSGAIDRISRFMLVLAVALTAAAWWRFGWRIALGFACGSVVYYGSLADPFGDKIGGVQVTVSRSYDDGLCWSNPVEATTTVSPDCR